MVLGYGTEHGGRKQWLYGKLEHSLPYIWIFVLLFINFGGVADEAADILLLAEALYIYFGGDASVLISASADDDEVFLLAVRALITVIGCLPSLLLIRLIFTTIPRTKQLLKKQFPEEFKDAEKPTRLMIATNSCMLLLSMILWKFAMVALRIGILVYLIHQLIKEKGRIPHIAIYKTQIFEVILMLDVVWSAVPLGVLTLYEIIWVEDFAEVLSTGGGVFEIIKLSSLCIDLVGVCHLIYFVIWPSLREAMSKNQDTQSETQSLI